MMKLPSPSMSITGRSGSVAAAPSAAGKPNPMAPSPVSSKPHQIHQQQQQFKKREKLLQVRTLPPAMWSSVYVPS
jgi:hypothetical protein